jgi:hypothetical protein
VGIRCADLALTLPAGFVRSVCILCQRSKATECVCVIIIIIIIISLIANSCWAEQVNN